jgi:hypothetical protein
MSAEIKIVLATLGVLACLFLYQIMYDPLSPYMNRKKLDSIQVEFDVAKEKWNSEHIENYSYEVLYSVPMWGGCGAKLTVKQGKLVEVIETMHGGIDKLPTPIALSQDQWDSDYCDYSKGLTIPEVFYDVEKIIKSNWSLEVVFDEQFGFIAQYYGSPNIRNGLLNGYITESEFGYTFSNFQCLDGTTP